MNLSGTKIINILSELTGIENDYFGRGDGRWRSEVRSRRSEVGSQRSEVGSRKSEVRSQKSEEEDDDDEEAERRRD